MARDAVLEINIDNPAAKEAFIRWWRTMEAQGYQYGYEALCNVWVGFDDGRADLASRVLALVETADTTYSDGDGLRTLDPRGVAVIVEALRDLFQREGIELKP